MDDENKYKIVVLGRGNVGKTSLIIRYIEDVFYDEYDAPVDFYEKQVSIDGQLVTINIQDTREEKNMLL